MSWDPVSPFMCGRQLRRFFDKHCTTIDMRGFNEDDWVLMTENQTWWRKEMMKLFPTALPEKDQELSDDHKDMVSIDTHRETVGLGLSDESLNLTSGRQP
ncbi:hypothetical protein BHE90_015822 [Fusarium euwallaceae]|uniref:Uncharacterized protein n=1 Tax=Fusarium euwallaceae TaxID=1147111 RepID=A0A430L267_9HYPO|nr:hypothetical protein BHE90_015822 [Fusarium euwallaceae]